MFMSSQKSLALADPVSHTPNEKTRRATEAGLFSGYMTHEDALPLEGDVNKPTQAGIHSEGGGQSSDHPLK